jgi:hypothetical protein
MKIIDTEKTVKQIKDAQDIFKEFDRLESSKPDF